MLLDGAGLGEIGQAESGVMEPSETGGLVTPAGRGQPGVQPGLDVHLVVAGPRACGHREAGRPGTEVAGQQVLNRALFGPRGDDRLADQPPGKPAQVSQFGLRITARGRRRCAAHGSRGIADQALTGPHN